MENKTSGLGLKEALGKYPPGSCGMGKVIGAIKDKQREVYYSGGCNVYTILSVHPFKTQAFEGAVFNAFWEWERIYSSFCANGDGGQDVGVVYVATDSIAIVDLKVKVLDYDFQKRSGVNLDTSLQVGVGVRHGNKINISVDNSHTDAKRYDYLIDRSFSVDLTKGKVMRAWGQPTRRV